MNGFLKGRLSFMAYRVFLLLLFIFLIAGCDYDSAETATPSTSTTPDQQNAEVYDIIPLFMLRHFVCSALGLSENSSNLYFSDNYYIPYRLETIQYFLSQDKTNEMSYIPELRDCDDYAKILMGRVSEAFEGIPFGIIWYTTPAGYFHAANIFYEAYTGTIFIIEPQDDSVKIASPMNATFIMMKGFTFGKRR